MTLLAVPIMAGDLGSARRAMADAQAGGAEMLELRLDLLPAGAAEALPPLGAVPVLATCRDRREGGASAAGDADRAAVLQLAALAGADCVDFELAAWNRSPAAERRLREVVGLAGAPGGAAAPYRCGLILSAHDFSGPPADLGGLVQALRQSPAAVVKIAFKANRITDCLAALDVLHDARRSGRSAIVLAMGEAGLLTRLLAKKLGAFLTFAALTRDKESAPGQPTLAEFKTLYRWDAVSATTALFGVIGWPVAHSMSPAIHNAAFDATGYDGLYVPLRVEPEAATFDELLDGIGQRNGWLNFRGLSVTIPHKENALRYVLAAGGRADDLSRRIGAINTIRFEDDGSLTGCNTDYAAALDAICLRLADGAAQSPAAALKGRRVAVLGAGGVARALVAGLVDAGARVTIFNRTADRARRLAEEFGCDWADFDARSTADAEIIVNATSVGMHPHADQTPLPGSALRAGQVVFDTIYNPARTRLLREAESAGARTADGLEMFVCQAAAQFEFWTGLPAPAEAMRRVVTATLRPQAPSQESSGHL